MLQPFFQLMANFYRAGTCIIKRFYDACQEELARKCIALTSNHAAHPSHIVSLHLETPHPQDELGIIGFSRHARILHNMVRLGNGIKSLQRALSDPSGSNSTNFTAALELAEACLWDKKPKSTGNFFSKLLSEILYETESHPAKRGRGSRNGAVKRIIMLTDGEHNQGGSPKEIPRRMR